MIRQVNIKVVNVLERVSIFMSKLILFPLVPIIIFSFATDLFGITTIKADNPNFQYTGRINFSVLDQPVIYWPGTYIKANFEG